MVCRVGLGMGTLIDSQWVITAAHVALALPSSDKKVSFGDREYLVSQVAIHPNFAKKDIHRDIALLRLATPVTDIPNAILYRKNDELNKNVIFVGDGRTGNGISGPITGKRVMRAAQNTVDRLEPGWLVFKFDTPPNGKELEGISGPGDSGGPAFLEQKGNLYLAGVSAYNDGDPQCFYESNEYYCRVSDEIEWIDSVMNGQFKSKTTPMLLRYQQNDDGSQSVVREEVVNINISQPLKILLHKTLVKLVASLKNNSVNDYLKLFDSNYLKRQQANSDPLEGMHQFLIGALKIHGQIISFHPISDKGLKIIDSINPMQTIVFHFQNGNSGYFGIALEESGLIDHFSVFVRKGICQDGNNCTKNIPLEMLVDKQK